MKSNVVDIKSILSKTIERMINNDLSTNLVYDRDYSNSYTISIFLDGSDITTYSLLLNSKGARRKDISTPILIGKYVSITSSKVELNSVTEIFNRLERRIPKLLDEILEGIKSIVGNRRITIHYDRSDYDNYYATEIKVDYDLSELMMQEMSGRDIRDKCHEIHKELWLDKTHRVYYTVVYHNSGNKDKATEYLYNIYGKIL